MTRWLAYAAYPVGSGLFLLGTLLYLLPDARRAKRDRRSPPDRHHVRSTQQKS